MTLIGDPPRSFDGSRASAVGVAITDAAGWEVTKLTGSQQFLSHEGDRRLHPCGSRNPSMVEWFAVQPHGGADDVITPGDRRRRSCLGV